MTTNTFSARPPPNRTTTCTSTVSFWFPKTPSVSAGLFRNEQSILGSHGSDFVTLKCLGSSEVYRVLFNLICGFFPTGPLRVTTHEITCDVRKQSPRLHFLTCVSRTRLTHFFTPRARQAIQLLWLCFVIWFDHLCQNSFLHGATPNPPCGPLRQRLLRAACDRFLTRVHLGGEAGRAAATRGPHGRRRLPAAKSLQRFADLREGSKDPCDPNKEMHKKIRDRFRRLLTDWGFTDKSNQLNGRRRN